MIVKHESLPVGQGFCAENIESPVKHDDTAASTAIEPFINLIILSLLIKVNKNK